MVRRAEDSALPRFAKDRGKTLIEKILLVLFPVLVKVTPTMKRTYTLIVLFAVVLGALLTGCGGSGDQTSPPATNAPAPATTNK